MKFLLRSNALNLSQKRSFSCKYEQPMFFRFGYIGAFLIGGVFAYGLRTDHILLSQNINNMRKEMKDIATKHQNDTARMITLLEEKGKR
jgi:hypothetical protein